MKTSHFVVLSFAGLICLAASILWFPLPQNQGSIDPPIEAGAAVSDDTSPAAVDRSATESTASPIVEADEVVKAQSSIIDANEPAVHRATATAHEETTTTPLIPLKFPDWPKPALAFVISGEQLGHFEPCGCTANQLGGMSRRASVFERVRSLGWDVRGIELGGLSKRSGVQAQMKFETTLTALRELQYVAMGLGSAELQLSPEYLLGQHLTDGELPLKFVSANVVIFGDPEIGTPVPSAIVELNGVKAGITSVMSPTIRKEAIRDMTAVEAATADLNCTDAEAALTAVMKSFDEQQVTFRVLLSHGTREEARELAGKFPTLDVIVSANGDAYGKAEPELIGSVQMIQVSREGRAVGLVAVYPNEPEKIRYELIRLDGRQIGDSPRMTELMQRYQELLRDQRVVTATEAVQHPSGSTFVGADKCGECHTTAMEIWKNTPHAHAFESLDPIHKRKGHERLHGVVRSFDPECIACHTTGWDPKEYVRFASGFINEEFAADDKEKSLEKLLSGNQCENCHGPGSRHVELIEAGDNAAAAKEVRVTLDQAEESCRNCHDLDNSPGFDFAPYWEKVKHYGKD